MDRVAHRIDFSGQVAIVTGGGNGIGRAYCLEMAKRGASVVVNDLGADVYGKNRSKQSADRVVDEIRSAGGTAIANYANVATREGGAEIVSTALNAFGRLDVLINNAGNMTDGAFEDQSDEQIEAMLDVHLKGAFHVSRPAFRAMKESGYGRIVFTGSSSAMFGHAWQTTYAAAKSGVIGLMNVLAIEGEPYGIKANAIMPSAVTRLMDAMGDGFTKNKLFAAAMARADLQSLLPYMQPAFPTPLAVYLASKACNSTHNLYSQAGNRYARVFIGVTKGWRPEGDDAPSAEDISNHWDEIEDRSEYYLPMTSYDEFAIISPAKNS